MNAPPGDPGCSHLLDAQQLLRLVLAAALPFFSAHIVILSGQIETMMSHRDPMTPPDVVSQGVFPVST